MNIYPNKNAHCHLRYAYCFPSWRTFACIINVSLHVKSSKLTECSMTLWRSDKSTPGHWNQHQRPAISEKTFQFESSRGVQSIYERIANDKIWSLWAIEQFCVELDSFLGREIWNIRNYSTKGNWQSSRITLLPLTGEGSISDSQLLSNGELGSWFKVAVLAADSAGTVPRRSRRCGPDSDETRETLHRGLKKCWKITTKL